MIKKFLSIICICIIVMLFSLNKNVYAIVDRAAVLYIADVQAHAEDARSAFMKARIHL